jgi:hypothetical protein
MIKQKPTHPKRTSVKLEYFDGEVTWDLMDTTDYFYNEMLMPMKPSRRYHGSFESKHFYAKLVWMRVDQYIDHQIHILNFDDPAARAFQEALSGHDFEEYLDFRNYDPFVAFEMSASEDRVDSIMKGITDYESVIPCGILIYGGTGNLTTFQEGRHRSLALHNLGIELMPVWVFTHRVPVQDLSQLWLETALERVRAEPEKYELVAG